MGPGTVALVVAVGVATGLFSALFGVGGGVLMVPFLVVVLGDTQHVAEGTSLLVIVPTALVGVLSHTRNRLVDFRAAALVAGGGLVGGYVGAEIALATDATTLTKLFAVWLAVMGAHNVGAGARALRG
jgi:uncharacterized membrane protein YfcA